MGSMTGSGNIVGGSRLKSQLAQDPFAAPKGGMVNNNPPPMPPPPVPLEDGRDLSNNVGGGGMISDMVNRRPVPPDMPMLDMKGSMRDNIIGPFPNRPINPEMQQRDRELTGAAPIRRMPNPNDRTRRPPFNRTQRARLNPKNRDLPAYTTNKRISMF